MRRSINTSPRTLHKGLGCSSVRFSSRLPRPAARIIADLISCAI
uniref:Uncharacterized protein n=1 Tax=Phage sp. ctqZP6 TaxID=2828010 RepID=A0A8S5SIH6_9VIRU|nr:MAG TPA: hypothetical protein [Phage sp. ctqZP6]